MVRGFRLRFCRLIPYFQSCRSKHPSNLPQNPVPKSSLHSESNHPRRSSFQHKIPSTFFSQLASKPNQSPRSSSSSDILGFNCQNCDVSDEDEAPRRKIYNSAASGYSMSPPEKNRKQRFRRKSTRRRRSFRMSTSSVDSGFFYKTEFGVDEIEEAEEEESVMRNRRGKEKQREDDRETTPARLSVFIKRSVVRCGAGKKKKVVVAEGKVRESFAVMKRSEQPYEDFKKSMIEMILDKEMFDKVELEQLLACFLSLNSSKYHGIIVQAFTDIWVSLFNL